MSPEILPYSKNLINYFLRKISLQEDQLEENANLDDFKKDIMTYELDRVKFMIKKYCRMRNQKIEDKILYIFQNDLSNLLSKDEFDYAVAYYKLLMKQFEL